MLTISLPRQSAIVARLRSTRPTAFAALALATLGFAYLRWTPLAPDLAAQIARAQVIRSGGIGSWWTGWFGGLSLPNYSVLVPLGMAVLGVRVIGFVAVAVGIAATTILTRAALRPRAGAITFAVAGVANLLDGRVTFAVGLAAATWALVAVRARRPILVLALSVGSYLASPLAGLFLGLILVVVALADPARRRSAAGGAIVLLLTGGGMAVLFPGTGTMPFRWIDAIPAGLSILAVWVLCPARFIRWTAAITLVGLPLFLLIPGAVGANITRLAWVAAVPIIVACAPARRSVVVVAAVALALWPLGDLAGQLRAGAGSAAQAAYYEPLQAEVAREQAQAGAAAIGQRIEVVDTAGHWESAYLPTLSLARGWDRQADYAYNPIFYQDGAFTAASYRGWLTSLAVGWVALPATALDYASVDEGRLIRSGLDYLRLTWSSPDWRLYRVVDSAPLVVGAQVLSVDSSGVVVSTTSASTVMTRIRWSPYLATSDPVSGDPIPTCVADADGWVDIVVPRAETVKLAGHFDASVRLNPGNGTCAGLVATGHPTGD